MSTRPSSGSPAASRRSASGTPASAARVGQTSTSLACASTMPRAATPLAGQQQWRPGLDHIERAVLAHMAALLREEVARRVHHRDVRAAGRVGEQRENPRRGIRIGVLPRGARSRAGALAVVGQEGHRVLAGDGVQPLKDLMTPVGVKSDPPRVAGSHRHRSNAGSIVRAGLDPDHEINDGGKVRRGQRPDDGLASGRHLRRRESAHDSRL